MIQVDIAAGWHSTALTDDGEVYGWGRGEHGRLGFGENDKSSKMVQQKVHLLAGEDIVQKAVAGLRRINLDGLRWRVFDAKGQLLNPTEFLEDIVIEHEHVECTSSVIQALVLFKKLHPGHRKKEIEHSITNAVRYIENMQMPDGSWYGDWGVCFTYGTWFALGGLAAAGKTFSTCAAMRNGVSRR